MQYVHFAIIVYICSMCFAQDISEHFKNKIQNDIQNTKRSWQPMSESNWIILNTELKRDSTSAEAHTTEMAQNNHRKSIYSHFPYRYLTASSTNAYEYSQTQLNFQKQQWHKEQGHSHPAPINYYTYNESLDGNDIAPTAADVKLIEPYILTISNMRAQTNTNTDAIRTRRVSQNIFTDAASKLPKNVLSDFVVSSHSKENQNQDIKNNSKYDSTITSALDVNNDKSESFFNKIEAHGVALNDVFLPLRHTLDKVIYFCDIAKRFLSNEHKSDDNDEGDDDSDYDDDDDDDGGDGDEKEDVNDNDLNDVDGPTENTSRVTTNFNALPAKFQGHQKETSKSSSTERSRKMTSKEIMTHKSVGVGRKIKKLKKKLSKFILPLLLAYKLKFLTLIPVLIGGLILLVGTTGLAGFFFALFTAVMTLKSASSSKSIIVKKI